VADVEKRSTGNGDDLRISDVPLPATASYVWGIRHICPGDWCQPPPRQGPNPAFPECSPHRV